LKVVTRSRRPRIRWVSELFLNESTDWNRNLISSIFLPVDVEAIMRIRVPERIMNDQIAWHYEKSGQFSVKSAYKLALKLQSQDQMASSSNPKQREKLCKGMPRISRRTGCKVFKAEKDELRDEKQKLELEKESLEHQMKLMTSTPAYMPHPTLMPAPFPQAPLTPFHLQAQDARQKPLLLAMSLMN